MCKTSVIFVLIGLDQNYSAYYNWGHTIDINQKVIIGIYRFIYRFSDIGFLSIALVGVMRKRQIAKQYHDHGAKQLPSLTSNWATGTS